jgi:hypothetical protein
MIFWDLDNVVWYMSAFKLEAARSAEMLVPIYQTAQHDIPEDLILKLIILRT